MALYNAKTTGPCTMEYAVAQLVGAGHPLAAEIVKEVYFGTVPDMTLRDGRVLIYCFNSYGLQLRWVTCPSCGKAAQRNTDLEYNAADCIKCNGLWLQSMIEEG